MVTSLLKEQEQVTRVFHEAIFSLLLSQNNCVLLCIKTKLNKPFMGSWMRLLILILIPFWKARGCSKTAVGGLWSLCQCLQSPSPDGQWRRMPKFSSWDSKSWMLVTVILWCIRNICFFVSSLVQSSWNSWQQECWEPGRCFYVHKGTLESTSRGAGSHTSHVIRGLEFLVPTSDLQATGELEIESTSGQWLSQSQLYSEASIKPQEDWVWRALGWWTLGDADSVGIELTLYWCPRIAWCCV